jgi:UDP-glucose 4-epimerase
MSQAILVTGGAGYVGSHAVRQLRRASLETVVVDDFSEGHRAAVEGPLEECDLADFAALKEIFARARPRAVMHFAASCLVGESVEDPAKYWRNNVSNTLNLLEAMREVGCDRFVFSSTCSVYGNPIRVPIDEDHPVAPINPYASTKAAIERALEEYERGYGLRWTALRYFNAAGASPVGGLGEDHDPETHLIPRVLWVAMGKAREVEVYGKDYPTPDGTCIRDYVHVDDLAQAHLLALEAIETGRARGVFNLGTGTGNSVLEVVETCARVTGKKIPTANRPRRPGDPPVLVSGGERAKKILGWAPRFGDLEGIVRTAWEWHRTHPAGFGDGTSEKA